MKDKTFSCSDHFSSTTKLLNSVDFKRFARSISSIKSRPSSKINMSMIVIVNMSMKLQSILLFIPAVAAALPDTLVSAMTLPGAGRFFRKYKVGTGFDKSPPWTPQEFRTSECDCRTINLLEPPIHQTICQIRSFELYANFRVTNWKVLCLSNSIIQIALIMELRLKYKPIHFVNSIISAKAISRAGPYKRKYIELSAK